MKNNLENNNLDLIRAKNALEAVDKIGAGKDGGDIVKKIPAYIINDGFLAAAAFAVNSGAGYEDVFAAIARHLKAIGRIDSNTPEGSLDLLNYLVKQDSAKLRDVTAEAMAYLNYLRRFAAKNSDGAREQ